MARPADPEEKKNQYLDAAFGLFMRDGYEHTSVNTIIEALGASKGAFYHYFRTKEDLLDQLAKRMARQVMDLIETEVLDSDHDAIEKLNMVFRLSSGVKAQNRDLVYLMLEVFFSSANVLLRMRMRDETIRTVGPVLERIIEQGVREGTMDVAHPRHTAGFILRIGDELVSELAGRLPNLENDPGEKQEMLEFMEFYGDSVERILGAPRGSVRIVDPNLRALIFG